MRPIKYLSFILLLLPVGIIQGQELLTLQSAIDQAIKNNLQIQIARTDAEIAANNNYAGNAGMLPSITFNAGDNPAVSSIRQEFTNGTVIERNNVASNAFNTNIALNYTLFDGARMFAARERLKALDELGQLELKTSVQNLMSDVIRQYSYITTQEKYLAVLRELLNVSEARMQLTETRSKAGLANQSDIYLALLDRESRQQAINSQLAAIRNAYTELNVLLHFPADTAYRVSPDVESVAELTREMLDSRIQNNPEFLESDQRVSVALQTRKEIAAARLPRIGLSATYGYSISQSQAGFSLYNQSFGPAALLNLTVPLFNGNTLRRNFENAELFYERSKLEQESDRQRIHADYEQAWTLYSTAIEQVKMDEVNVITAEKYLTSMEERYRLGESTVIEFREAQRSYEETTYRLITNKYLLKLAETDLLRLTGQLIR